MRPAGEVRQALVLACEQLATPGSGCTLRELADAARVGVDACRRAVDNMRRAGVLVKVGERRVSYGQLRAEPQGHPRHEIRVPGRLLQTGRGRHAHGRGLLEVHAAQGCW